MAWYANIKGQMMGRFLMQSGAAELYDTPAAYDRLADRMVFGGTPHLDTATLDALGAAGALTLNPAAFWASIAFIIDATHNPDTTRQGQGLSSLMPDETAALDHAVHLSAPGLSWQEIAANYLSLLPQPEDVRGPDDDVITGTTGDDTIDGGAFDVHAKRAGLYFAPEALYRYVWSDAGELR